MYTVKYRLLNDNTVYYITQSFDSIEKAQTVADHIKTSGIYGNVESAWVE